MAKINVKQLYDTCGKIIEEAERQAADGKEIDPSILEGLTSAYQKIIEFLKIYLISAQDKFYGSLLMDMDITIDYTQRGPVDLKIKKTPYNLTINPLFLKNYKFPEFVGLIIDEILKMVWLHPTSFADMNREKDPQKHQMLEKASDAASTSILKRDVRIASANNDFGEGNSNGVRLPNSKYTTASINDEFHLNVKSDMPIEYYFKIIEKFRKPNEESNQQSPANNNSNSVATTNNSAGNPVHNWEDSDSDEVKETITSMVSNVYNSLDEKSRGLMPSSIVSQIKKLLAPPEINWKQVLAKMIGSVPVPYRKTRTRLNRRQPYRADLCGRLPKKTVNIVCCFDTSGSMSDKDIMYCMNEVFNLIKIYEGFKVTIVECDATVQRVYEARKISEVDTKCKGRGGTSFIPAIEYINGEGNYKNNRHFPNAGKYKDALMVYFTDGFGDYEIPKPKTYRNLWVVLHDTNNLSCKEPYGDVKSLSMDSDYKKFVA